MIDMKLLQQENENLKDRIATLEQELYNAKTVQHREALYFTSTDKSYIVQTSNRVSMLDTHDSTCTGEPTLRNAEVKWSCIDKGTEIKTDSHGNGITPQDFFLHFKIIDKFVGIFTQYVLCFEQCPNSGRLCWWDRRTDNVINIQTITEKFHQQTPTCKFEKSREHPDIPYRNSPTNASQGTSVVTHTDKI